MPLPEGKVLIRPRFLHSGHTLVQKTETDIAQQSGSGRKNSRNGNQGQEGRSHIGQGAEETNAKNMQGFVIEKTETDMIVYTDEAMAYVNMPRRWHKTVCHSAGGYVSGMAHANGMESSRAILRHGHAGVHHKFGRKHLQRYVAKFYRRENIRNLDTIDQMREAVRRMTGKHPDYRRLTS